MPISRVRRTSHTCLLVSGVFLSGIVFPPGACFSRLKADDVCHCMRVALLLRQIECGREQASMFVVSDTVRECIPSVAGPDVQVKLTMVSGGMKVSSHGA